MTDINNTSKTISIEKNSHIKIALVSGEFSGDSCGAVIISKIKSHYPNAEFIGIGGPKMQAAGLKSIIDIEKLSVIGIVNIIKKLPELIKIKNNLINYIVKSKVNLYIGIDAPDFNIRVERKLKKISNRYHLNIKTIQYISPTVWAWRPKRIFKVAKATDTVLCIFPFEQEIYRTNNIKADFVGHPLLDKVASRDNKDTAHRVLLEHIDLDTNNIHNSTKPNLIGILPGSRVGEIKQLSEVFIKSAYKIFSNNPSRNLYFIIPIVSEKIYKEFIGIYNKLKIKVDIDFKSKLKIIKLYNNKNLSSLDIIQACDLILCSSGTTTLEACLLTTPMVVAYKVSKLNETLIKLLIKINYIAMPNIISDKLFGEALVPEFVQEQVTIDNLSNSMQEQFNKYILDNNGANRDEFSKWDKIKSYLQHDNINHDDAVFAAIDNIIKEK